MFRSCTRAHVPMVASLMLVVAACASRTGLPILTDPSVQRVPLCDAAAALPHVVGVLDGSPAASVSSVWLTDASGRRVVIRWPAGYSVRPSPSLQLLAEDGAVVATVGQRLDLPHAALADHEGTFEDPYPAVGLVGDRCYERR